MLAVYQATTQKQQQQMLYVLDVQGWQRLHDAHAVPDATVRPAVLQIPLGMIGLVWTAQGSPGCVQQANSSHPSTS